MREMTVYMIPHSSFRGSSLPRSDTLFGAICWGHWLLFGEDCLQSLLDRFKDGKPPFLVSSMFTYVQHSERKTHFFPKPLAPPFSPDSPEKEPTLTDLSTLKKFQKQRIVDGETFTRIISADVDDTELYRRMKQSHANFSKNNKAPEVAYVPHSAINRISGTVDANRFFYTEEFSLSPDTDEERGVFFCAKCHDDFEKDLKTVFSFLTDKGIGGDVSVGKGHFRGISIEEGLPYHEPSEQESTHVVTLSLTYPDPELRKQLPNSWYALERRQGKIESMYVVPASGHLWKDHLLMLQEGSTFPKQEQHYYGGVPIVREAGQDLNFDVRHYGYAFTVNTRHIKHATAKNANTHK